MSDFTIDDTMAQIRYELDDREIYNDIRSEIGIVTSETVVDDDATYKWKTYRRSMTVPAGSLTYTRVVTTNLTNPLTWRIGTNNATDMEGKAYYSYNITLNSSDDERTKAVVVRNTGGKTMNLYFEVRVKFKATEEVSHEELIPNTLAVRSTSSSSIQKYGRRVMNLTWTEGTSRKDMQSLVEHYIERYEGPVARLTVILQGKTDALRTQIITREISDILTIASANLGLNADCFINSISTTDGPTGIPVCTWGLEIQRTYELLTLFLLDTSELDGAHVLGS